MAGDAPKTAYELAMERLRQKEQATGETERPLTDAQKAAIGEARNMYQARVAEREILHRGAVARAGSYDEVERLGEELRRDLERLATDRDRKIDEIRKQS